MEREGKCPALRDSGLCEPRTLLTGHRFFPEWEKVASTSAPQHISLADWVRFPPPPPTPRRGISKAEDDREAGRWEVGGERQLSASAWHQDSACRCGQSNSCQFPELRAIDQIPGCGRGWGRRREGNPDFKKDPRGFWTQNLTSGQV